MMDAGKVVVQADVAKDEALDWFRKMALIRRFEERAEEAYGEGKIGGFLHLYIGEEAVAVGAMQALTPDDAIVATYREHGQALARGVPVKNERGEVACWAGINLDISQLKQAEAALRASVALHYDPEKVTLQISDDGSGFDPNEAFNPPRGWGLAGMRERVESLSGKLDIRSAPGSGTTVEVVLPLHKDEGKESLDGTH